MLSERRRERWYDPELAARYLHNYALAEAALVESQRCKQGPPTGTPRLLPRRGRVKLVQLPRLLAGQANPTVSSALHRVDELLQEARLSPPAFGRR